MERFKPSWMPDTKKQYERSRWRKEDKAFYDSARWKALRLDVLLESVYSCAVCDGIATDVDHIIPRKVRPDLEWEKSNLQPLCKPCHSRKSARERHAGG